MERSTQKSIYLYRRTIELFFLCMSQKYSKYSEVIRRCFSLILLICQVLASYAGQQAHSLAQNKIKQLSQYSFHNISNICSVSFYSNLCKPIMADPYLHKCLLRLLCSESVFLTIQTTHLLIFTNKIFFTFSRSSVECILYTSGHIHLAQYDTSCFFTGNTNRAFLDNNKLSNIHNMQLLGCVFLAKCW